MSHKQALSLAAAAAGPPVNISGRWSNELGSWVEFRQGATGVLSGHYHSAVSIGGGPVDSDDLTGYVHGPLVSFMVRWPNASITAWVGQHIVDQNTGDETIDTLWQMTMLNSDGQGGYWHSIMAGSDIFER